MPLRTLTRAVPLFLLVLFVSGGGDPKGLREPLWHRYFETDPRFRDLYGTIDIPRSDRARCEEIEGLFGELGAADLALEPSGEGGGCPGNVIVSLVGEIPDAIIVSAHLDRAGEGEGAVDDFSGVVMLGMLYTYFRDRPHKHTLVFVAFDGEEAGLLGSRRFVAMSPHMPRSIRAVVNLECLGVDLPRAWAEGSSESLVAILAEAGKERGLSTTPVSIKNVMADSIPFLEAGYPAITVEGIDPADVRLLGTAWDRAAVVREDIFDVTFALLVVFIDRLDAHSRPLDPANVH
jgi:hypothetical protein